MVPLPEPILPLTKIRLIGESSGIFMRQDGNYTTALTPWKKESKFEDRMKDHAGTSAIYGLGFLGALVYFLQRANGLDGAILGIIKAIIWPGIFVYKIFQSMGL